MSPTHQVKVVLVEELGDDVRPKRERDASIILAPSAQVSFRILVIGCAINKNQYQLHFIHIQFIKVSSLMGGNVAECSMRCLWEKRLLRPGFVINIKLVQWISFCKRVSLSYIKKD